MHHRLHLQTTPKTSRIAPILTDSDMSTLRKIRALLTPAESRSALMLLLLMLVGMFLETLGIGLVIPAIALLTQGNLAEHYPSITPILAALDNPGQAALIAYGMLTLVAVYLVKTLFLAFLAWRQAQFAYGVQAQLSQRLFTTYIHQPYTFHLQRNSAQLIRNAINEVSVFTGNAMQPSMLLLAEGLVLLGIGSLLLTFEPFGALIVALVLGGAAWGFNRITRSKIGRWGEARQFHEGLRIQHLQQGLGGAKDVKLLGRERNFLAQYSEHNTRSARVAQFQTILQQLPRLWLELLAVAGMALLVLSMLAQDRDMSSIMPTLGLFAIAAFRLMPSVNRVLGAVQSLRYGLPVINTLYAELQLNSSSPAAQSINGLVLGHEIRLQNVEYTYPSASLPALNGLSITIKKGESIGFIGSSGSGKSTLVDIMLGLLPPQTGQVLVDGHDIQKNLRHWQDQIGYVPQSIFLIDDTLRRNVAFGLSDDCIDDAQVQRAIHAAQLQEFVADLPNGLDTMVGERGVRLSGGQRQRIGIARALYHDPSILVLDEATSALDTVTEHDVMQAITALHGEKTILIVAHRLSTVEQCDRLYRLEHGKVTAQGSPAEMLTTQNISTPMPQD